MMLYRNTKVKVHLPDGDIDFFEISAGVLQGDTEAPYLFIIYRDNVLRTLIDIIKENGFTRSRQETITDTHYAYDIALFVNTPIQAESLQYSLEQATGGIGLDVKANKTGCTCFNRERAIYTLNGGPLKLVKKFTFFGSSVSSTE